MKFVRKKGFTIIELIGVLVVMAIIALIVTSLVMNIIRKARIAADKRSVDAYGRSIELAIASYLLDNGKFPTRIDDLTIEYTGSKVQCTTTQLNDDSSVYLADCSVDNRAVTNYTYGKSANEYDYKVGDVITHNGVSYYVLKDSRSSDTDVTMLKAEPLTVDEVNTYGAGHVNMHYTLDTNSPVYQKAFDELGYGAIQYYSSETCGVNQNDEWVYSGCTTDYNSSEVKYVVDAWVSEKVPNGLKEARLLKFDEYLDNCEVEENTSPQTGQKYVYCVSVHYDWLWPDYHYYTMTPVEGEYSYTNVYGISRGGSGSGPINEGFNCIRPVITISKSVLQ